MSGETRGRELPGTLESPGTLGSPGAESPETREARLRAKNRKALIVIVAICLVLASAGFAFVRWLLSQPPGES